VRTTCTKYPGCATAYAIGIIKPLGSISFTFGALYHISTYRDGAALEETDRNRKENVDKRSQLFPRGTWAGQISRQNRNAVQGRWTLLNAAGEIILEGTWSAQKTVAGWRGTWPARARKGAPLSGAWNADPASFSGKVIHAMLERTAEERSPAPGELKSTRAISGGNVRRENELPRKQTNTCYLSHKSDSGTSGKFAIG